MAHTPFVLTVWVLLGAVLALVWTRQGGSQLVDSTARRSDLHPPAEDWSAVLVARLRGRATAGGVGMAVALLPAAFLLPGDLEVGRIDLGVPVLLGVAFLGAAVGTATHTVLLARRPVEGGPRVARPREVAVADYVHPLERGSALATAVLAPVLAALVLVLVLVGVLDAPPVSVPLVVLTGVLPPLTLGAGLAVSRLVLGLPQPATSSLELAWDDALRAQSLRDVVTVPLYAGLTGSVLVIAHAGMSLPDPLSAVVVPVVVLGAMATLGLLLVAMLVSRPTRHFRRRLWPDPAATGPTGRTAAAGQVPAGAPAPGAGQP